MSEYSDLVLAKNPVAYWRLGEVSPSTVAQDSSGNGHNGTYSGSPTQEVDSLIVGDSDYAVTFNGVDQLLDTTFEGVTGTNAVTVEAWVIADSQATGSGQTICFYGTTSPATNGAGFYFGLSTKSDGSGAGYLRLGVTGAAAVYDGADLRDGMIHHVAVVVPANATVADVKMYIDGKPVALGLVNGAQAINIGNIYPVGISSNSQGAGAWHGTLDEVAMYDRALAPWEIKEHYLVGVYAEGYARVIGAKNPVAYWRLGDVAGSTAVDATRRGHDLTYHNTPTLGVDSLLPQDSDNAVMFNGTDQYAQSASAGPFLLSDLSFELWLKFATTGDQRPIYIYGGADGFALFATQHDSPLPRAVVWKNGTPAAVIGANAINDNESHHVAVTRSGTVVSLYVDGQLQGTANTVNADPLTGSNPLFIGCDVSLSNHYEGTIDEVAVFDYALSAADVASLYAAGSGRGGFQIGGFAGEY